VRPVLVGIAPSRPGSEGQPLSALGGRSTGATLAELAGLSASQYMMRFDRVNLCATTQASTIRTSVGRPYAEMLAGSLLRGRRVVLLGMNVVECFGLEEFRCDLAEWFDTREIRPQAGWAGYRAGMVPPFNYAILPHPSGRNRWYNEPANRERARAFMTELAEGWEGAD